MSLKTVFFALIIATVTESQHDSSPNGSCSSSGSPCINDSDCKELECIPLSFYKELLINNNNTSTSCEENMTSSISDYPMLYLPRINLETYKTGNPEEIKELINLFDEYLHTFSIVSLYNHGIEDELFDELYLKATMFFDKPLEYKMKYKTDILGNSGYDPWKWVSAARRHGIHDQPLDLTDAFSRYNHDGKNGEYGPPNCPDYLLNISNIYIQKIENVLHTVHEIAALSLGLDVNYFNDLHQVNPSYHLRLFHYPQINLSNIEPNAMRVSQHTDYLGFVLYRPDTVRGLQIKIRDGLWIDAKPKHKYDLVLNIGEFFGIWTNNHWTPTLHRAIPVSKQRLTLSFFTGTDQEVIIQQIKECSK
eukprot:290019_1